MTKTEALAIAKDNHDSHMHAEIQNMFYGAQKVNGADYGFHNGWYVVGKFSFPIDALDNSVPAHSFDYL